ncbi:TPA: hypothetical protein L6B05_01945 [Pseudomonas aeruginosa]|nr:hypothetical protein [Pseudomonas aeruginosa]
MQQNENFAKQAEQAEAEAERPEVVAVMESNGAGGKRLAQRFPIVNVFVGDELMTVAQHERIAASRWERAMDLMGDHVARISDKLTAERDAALAEVERLRQFERICEGLPQDAIDGGWTVQGIRRYAKRLEDQLKVALARVAELEKQEPVATVAKVPGEDWNSLDFHRELQDMHPGTKLYAAPVAQAQPEETPGEILAAKLIETWVTKHGKPAPWSTAVEITALATNMPNDERDRLLALDDDVDAQAQHSVPAYVSYTTRPAESLAGIALRQLKDESRWVEIRDINAHTFPDMQSHSYYPAGTVIKLPAAAPGTEVPQAWLDVQAERRRQITAEGWTPYHDDLYCAAELPRAAAAYILSGANDEAPAIWPFVAKWWKPRDARANYVRAGALILAEIERLDRAAAPGKEGV